MPDQQPEGSFVVTVVPSSQTRERTVSDVIVGSLAIVVVLVCVAMLLGGLFAAIRFSWQRRHPPDADHMPPVSPPTKISGSPNH